MAGAVVAGAAGGPAAGEGAVMEIVDAVVLLASLAAAAAAAAFSAFVFLLALGEPGPEADATDAERLLPSPPASPSPRFSAANLCLLAFRPSLTAERTTLPMALRLVPLGTVLRFLAPPPTDAVPMAPVTAANEAASLPSVIPDAPPVRCAAPPPFISAIFAAAPFLSPTI